MRQIHNILLRFNTNVVAFLSFSSFENDKRQFLFLLSEENV